MKTTNTRMSKIGFIEKMIIKCKAWLYLLACIIPVFISNNAEAAVYFSRASGNWNATTTWSTTGYGGAAAASTPGAAAGDVVLLSGYSITVTATPANAVLSITISQNNNTGNDTKLDLNTAGITLTANSMSVLDNNRSDNIDVIVSSTAKLQVNGSVSATRSTTNNQDERLRFNILNNGRMNVTGNFTYTYNRAKNSEPTGYEIQLDNSGRLDVNGNMNITMGNNNGSNNDFEFVMSNTAICNIGGQLNSTLSNSNDNDLISFILNGGTLTVTGACNTTVATTASNNSITSYYLYNNAIMSTGAFVYTNTSQDFNNSHEIELNNTSSFTVNGNFTATYGCNGGGGGTDFNIVLNNTPSMHITGNSSITIQNTNEDDGIYLDINGGTFIVDGTFTSTIAATATQNNTMDLLLDGGAMTTGAFTINHNGGGSGDINIKLNSGSTASASSLTVNGALTMTHSGGDNMYIENNANGTINVTGTLTETLTASADGDNIYQNFNGGTATFNAVVFDLSSGATNSNYLYYEIDGGTVNVTNNFTVRQTGGGGKGDANLWFNRNSTASASILSIGGNLTMSHSGGDNMEIELNNNATVNITGSLIDTLASSDGDDFFIDINGGSLTVNQNFNHVQTTLGSVREDLDVRIDGTGVFNVNGSVSVNQQTGGQVIFYLNANSGSTAQMNFGSDFTITNGGAADGVYIETNNSSSITVGGNLTINNNASGGDLDRIRMKNTSSISVTGSLTMNLLSGLTSQTNNIEFDMNGGTMTVGRNLTLNGISGKDALITLDGACVLTVTDSLILNHTGGNLTYLYLGNSSGSPVVTLGTLKLYDSGGGQSRFRMWNSSVCTVNGNITMNAVTAAQLDIALYNTATLKIKGSFIRSATPNRFGLLSCATTSTVEYCGTANSQTIAGDAGSGGDGFTLGKVIFNNTSGINPAFLMTAAEGNLTIPANANLAFTSGITSTSASALLIIANNATVSGANDASYVQGPIRKVGNQAFTFPVGASNNYQPATISAPSNNAHHFTAEYIYTDPNASYNVTSKDATLNHVSRNEYWIINRTNGASNVTVTLSWDGSSGGVTNLANMRVARWDGAVWRDHGNGATTGNTSAGTVITSGSVTSWAATSPFSLASSTSSNPLPVSLIRFEAFRIGNNVSLTWATASEKDNDHFEIERSKDGINFEILTKVAGAGNSNELRNYNANDNNPLIGTSYYRLKQVDYNGAFTYSPIKCVRYDTSTTKSEISVYPNPSHGVFIKVKLKENMLQTVNAGNNIGVNMFDLNGVKVFSTNKLVVEDSNEGIVKFNNPIQPGIYAITFTSDQTVDKQFVVIE